MYVYLCKILKKPFKKLLVDMLKCMFSKDFQAFRETEKLIGKYTSFL